MKVTSNGKKYMKLGIIVGIIFAITVAFVAGDTINEKIGILAGFGIAALGLFILVSFVNFLFRKSPESYQIENDAIRIPIFLFYSVKIKFEDIKEITKEPATHFSFRTVYLPTRLGGSVLIRTKHGSNYVVTPKDPNAFIEDVKKGMGGSPR